MLKEYYIKRNEMLLKDREQHFSYDLKDSFTQDELKADQILKTLRKPCKNDFYNVTNQNFFEKRVSIATINRF